MIREDPKAHYADRGRERHWNVGTNIRLGSWPSLRVTLEMEPQGDIDVGLAVRIPLSARGVSSDQQLTGAFEHSSNIVPGDFQMSRSPAR